MQHIKAIKRCIPEDVCKTTCDDYLLNIMPTISHASVVSITASTTVYDTKHHIPDMGALNVYILNVTCFTLKADC